MPEYPEASCEKMLAGTATTTAGSNNLHGLTHIWFWGSERGSRAYVKNLMLLFLVFLPALLCSRFFLVRTPGSGKGFFHGLGLFVTALSYMWQLGIREVDYLYHISR